MTKRENLSAFGQRPESGCSGLFKKEKTARSNPDHLLLAPSAPHLRQLRKLFRLVSLGFTTQKTPVQVVQACSTKRPVRPLLCFLFTVPYCGPIHPLSGSFNLPQTQNAHSAPARRDAPLRECSRVHPYSIKRRRRQRAPRKNVPSVRSRMMRSNSSEICLT